MAGMDERKDQCQIYMEKLIEVHKQNEDLSSQNKILSTERDNLLQQNNELSFQNKNLCMQNDNLLQQNEKLNLQNSSLLSKNKELDDQIFSKQVDDMRSTSKKRLIIKILPLLIIIVCLLIFVNIYYIVELYSEMESYSRSYEYEQQQRMQAEEDLEQALTGQAEAEKALDLLHSELSELSKRDFKINFKSFHAEENILVLHVGETRTIKIYQQLDSLSIEPSNEDAITAAKSENDVDSVQITAHLQGIFTVHFWTYRLHSGNNGYNFIFSRKFDILVIVLDE